MKSLVFIALSFIFISCQESGQDSAVKSLNSDVKNSEMKEAALPDELQDPEDCDEKAKKAEEVVEVNLGESNDAGCTIE